MLHVVPPIMEMQEEAGKVMHGLLPNDKLFMEEESTLVKLYLVGLKCLMVLCAIVLMIIGLLFIFLDRAPREKIILLRDLFQQNQTNTTG